MVIDMLEKRGKGRGRGGRGRGRGKGKGSRGRGKKPVTKNCNEFTEEVLEEEEEDEICASIEEEPEQEMIIPEGISLEEDILQLETPTFTTIDRGPPEPMLRLRWDHRVNLIGEKVLNPMIHVCELCQKPILIYGRMIACKHVFCHACAQKDSKNCARCKDKVDRVEQAGLGSIFMCTHGGTRYGTTGCRRTYMSSRDLQAHISHRHLSRAVVRETESRSVSSHTSVPQKIETVKEQARAVEPSPRDPRRHSDSGPTMPDTPPVRPDSYSSHSITNNSGGSYHSLHQTQGSHIPVLNTRNSTLITVPLQDTSPETYPPLSQPLAYPSPTYVSTQPYNYPQTVSYTQPPPPTHYPPPHLNYPPPPPPPHVQSYSQTPPQPSAQYPDPQYTTQWNTPPPPPRHHGQSSAHQYYR